MKVSLLRNILQVSASLDNLQIHYYDEVIINFISYESVSPEKEYFQVSAFISFDLFEFIFSRLKNFSHIKKIFLSYVGSWWIISWWIISSFKKYEQIFKTSDRNDDDDNDQLRYL